MSKATHLSLSIPASRVSIDLSDRLHFKRYVPSNSPSVRQQSGSSDFLAVALFSGIGLLISLVAILFGAQGVWF